MKKVENGFRTRRQKWNLKL